MTKLLALMLAAGVAAFFGLLIGATLIALGILVIEGGLYGSAPDPSGADWLVIGCLFGTGSAFVVGSFALAGWRIWAAVSRISSGAARRPE